MHEPASTEPSVSCPAFAETHARAHRWLRSHAVLAGLWLCLLGARSPAQRIEAAQTALLNPRAIAVNPVTHRMYVVDQPRGRVLMVDGVNGATQSIPVGKSPDALAIDPELNRIYVVNSASDTVSAIDGATQSVIATLATGRMPYAIQIDAGLHRALVMNTYSNFVTEIDESTNQTRSLPLGAKDAVEIDTRLHRSYLLGYEDPALTVLDERNHTTSRAPAVMHLWGLAVDEARGILYATEAQSQALLAIHEDSGAETTIAVGAMPCAAGVDSRTGLVYVLNYAGNSVTVVDGPAGKVLATIPVGDRPEAIAVDPARDRIYVANTYSNSVSVIDGHTRTVVANLPAERNPYAIAVDSEHGDVYVANFGSPSYTRLTPAARSR